MTTPDEETIPALKEQLQATQAELESALQTATAGWRQ